MKYKIKKVEKRGPLARAVSPSPWRITVTIDGADHIFNCWAGGNLPSNLLFNITEKINKRFKEPEVKFNRSRYNDSIKRLTGYSLGRLQDLEGKEFDSETYSDMFVQHTIEKAVKILKGDNK